MTRFRPLYAKLHPPRLSFGQVPRARLVARLAASTAEVVVLSAPAGAGKTTGLAQWVAADARPAAWLNLDPADNDPLTLLRYLVLAISRVVPVEGDVSAWLQLARPPVRELILPAVTDATAAAQPFLLAVDDAQVLTSLQSWNLIDIVLGSLPAGAQAAFATRTEPALPLGRMKAAGLLEEVGPTEFVMDDSEAAELFRLRGIQVDAETVSAVQRIMEGWAAGLHLTALANRSRGTQHLIRDLSGSRHDIARFLTSEVLVRQPDEVREFLVRTSILERLSADLCRHVSGRRDAEVLLERIVRENLFVNSYGHHEGWYRYHPVFADLLRAELEKRDGAEVTELHRRAADWCERHDEPGQAVRHRLAAGDAPGAAALVSALFPRYAGAGRVETVRTWLELFSDEQILGEVPLTLTAGWVFSMTGDPRLGRLWSNAALSERADDSPSPDGAASLRASQAALRASLAPDGVRRMLVDAELAHELETTPGTPWHAAASTIVGLARWLAGEKERAREPLRSAAQEGSAFNVVAELGALGYLSLIAADEDRWEEADAQAREGARRVAESGFGGFGPSLPVHLAQVLVAAHRGDPLARTKMQQVEEVLTHTVCPPYLHALAMLVLGEVALQQGDAAVAQRYASAAAGILNSYPDAGILTRRLQGLQRALEGLRLLEPLTPTEHHVLRLLDSRFSRSEIAARLFVSQNTVNTHVKRLYRKLGVHSRAAAIDRAEELGLLPRET